jgi:hypothetical protein
VREKTAVVVLPNRRVVCVVKRPGQPAQIADAATAERAVQRIVQEFWSVMT